MLKIIIKKEVLVAFRDVRIQTSALLMLALMITAVLVGKEGQKQIMAEREAAQTEMYDQWLNQDEKNPHSAAHYGQFAFKPKSVLSFLDMGLDTYTGVSVFLEAHKQHEVLFSRAQDSNSMIRFGELTGSLIFQLLIPLLIIFLAFNTFSKEREEGTLKLIHGQGLSMKTLITGKLLGIYLAVMVLFIPITLLAYLLLDQQAASFDNQIIAKFLILITGYAIYFLIFTLIAMLVSAFSKSSDFSLLSLIGIWILACIILPKASASLADKIYPSPSQFEFRNAIAEKVQNGIDGHNPSDERLENLKQQVLDKYEAETIEELPVNWGAISLQAGEEYTDQVYDMEFSKIEQTFRQQNRLSEWVGFLDPYLAIRNLSMGLAGTDFHHHVTFAKAAEAYRRDFVKKMNKDMELNQKADMDYDDYSVGREVWANIAPFQYDLPDTTDILIFHWRGIAALLFWLTLLTSLSIIYSKKIPKL